MILLVLCFALPAVPVFSQDSPKKPKMVIEESIYNAGDIYRTKEKVEHSFVIKNTGAAELKILSAKPG
jgi:hypothetical protein